MFYKHMKKSDKNKTAGKLGGILGIIAALALVFAGASYIFKGTDLSKNPDKNLFEGKVILLDAVGGITENEGLEQAYLGSVTLVPAYDSYKDTEGITLNTVLALKEKLEDAGAIVYLIRDSKYKDILNSEKGEFATHIKADLFIEVSCGMSENTGAEGVSGFYQSDEHSKRETSNISRGAAEAITDSVSKELSARNNGVIPKSWSPDFNFSLVPAVRINLGFATNQNDMKKLKNSEYIQKAVYGIYKGIGFQFKMN